MTPIVSFVGKPDVGKTTVLEKFGLEYTVGLVDLLVEKMLRKKVEAKRR